MFSSAVIREYILADTTAHCPLETAASPLVSGSAYCDCRWIDVERLLKYGNERANLDLPATSHMVSLGGS
jgi:hypothetical protein